MAEVFSAGEIAQIGIRIEQNGRDFYTELAKTSKSDEVKSVFLYLAKEEEQHIKVFRDLLSTFENYEPKEAYSEEYFSYLTAMSKEYVFTEENKGVQIAQNIHSDIEAIEVGIGFEKDSILFYHEIRHVVWKGGHSIIDKLIDEERKHLSKLIGIKTDLS